jgi:hypothetical protein
VARVILFQLDYLSIQDRMFYNSCQQGKIDGNSAIA